MPNASDIRDQLNVRRGMEIGERETIEEALLWCFCHDIHPVLPWTATEYDPSSEERLRLAGPLLEDYLNLIIKNPGGFDVQSLTKLLIGQIDRDLAEMDVDSDGEITTDAMMQAFARFQTAKFDSEARDREVSIYPFDRFDVDLFSLRKSPPKNLTDHAANYLADNFRKFFPKTCQVALSAQYSTNDDGLYGYHVGVIHIAMRSFVYGNVAIPSVDRFGWRECLESWARWATMIVGPGASTQPR